MARKLFPDAEIRARMRRFRGLMDERELAGFLVTDPENVRYLSGFTGHESWLFVPRRGRPKLITDFRYIEEAEATCVGTSIVEYGRKKKSRDTLTAGYAAAAKKRQPRLGVEKDVLTVAGLAVLRRAVGRTKKCWRITPVSGMPEQLRLTKSPAEVRLIQKALRIQEAAFRDMQRWIKPGMTERQCAARLEYEMKEMGAQSASFPIIVAEGPRASLPHAQPGDRKLRRNSPVLVDWGARYRFYNSDLTRMIFLGTIPRDLRKVYGIVLSAQLAAIAAVRPGVTGKAVDAAARNVITDAGYGKTFGHGTGHGIGLYIHEGPRVSGRSNTVLTPGMIITIEPGIYLPGRFGVRIEDDVLVTDKGRRVLSRLEKEI